MTNRIIKFRAWDGKQMYTFEFGDIYNTGLRRGTMGTNQDLAENHTWRLWNINHPKMQFTGLLDKNGKEIYEGDIMLGWESNGVYIRKGVVYFDQGRFMVKLKGVPRHLKTVCLDYEAVTNIYEDPYFLPN